MAKANMTGPATDGSSTIFPEVNALNAAKAWYRARTPGAFRFGGGGAVGSREWFAVARGRMSPAEYRLFRAVFDLLAWEKQRRDARRAKQAEAKPARGKRS